MSAAIVPFRRAKPAGPSRAAAELDRLFFSLPGPEQDEVIRFLQDVHDSKIDSDRRWANRAMQTAALNLWTRLQRRRQARAEARLARRKARDDRERA